MSGASSPTSETVSLLEKLFMTFLVGSTVRRLLESRDDLQMGIYWRRGECRRVSR